MTRPGRHRFQGTVQILRYNWPFYAGGLIVLAAGGAIVGFVPLPWVLRAVGMGALALGLWWWLASIAVSYWVYDTGDLMRWGWLEAWLPEKPQSWINMHAGLDESTPALAGLWGPPAAVYDFFSAQDMTEASIHRARSLATNKVKPECVDFRELPASTDSIELVTQLFAAHELRSTEARDQFFLEIYRILKSGGRAVLVEHLRDPANFAAFGPGFTHFLPKAEWRRVATTAGFQIGKESCKTPFVATMLLEKR